jgi:hypothetical protein
VELTPEILFVGDWTEAPLTDLARSETGQSNANRSETGQSNGDKSETGQGNASRSEIGQGRPGSEVKA